MAKPVTESLYSKICSSLPSHLRTLTSYAALIYRMWTHTRIGDPQKEPNYIWFKFNGGPYWGSIMGSIMGSILGVHNGGSMLCTYPAGGLFLFTFVENGFRGI